VKRVLITGASRGLGRAVAGRFASAGFSVHAANRTITSDEWRQTRCDLSAPDDVDNLVQTLLKEPPYDVCILNAATRKLGITGELTTDHLRASLEVNVVSAFAIAAAILPPLAKAGGDLVVLGSNASQRPFEGGAAYCSSKAALVSLAHVWDLEYGPQGARVTTLLPGAIANRPKTHDSNKMTTQSVAEVVFQLVTAPRDVCLRTVCLEPSQSLSHQILGIDRLLYRT
jgi:3-oxoacyl-[acyl-carrier protein] reductase